MGRNLCTNPSHHQHRYFFFFLLLFDRDILRWSTSPQNWSELLFLFSRRDITAILCSLNTMSHYTVGQGQVEQAKWHDCRVTCVKPFRLSLFVNTVMLIFCNEQKRTKKRLRKNCVNSVLLVLWHQRLKIWQLYGSVVSISQKSVSYQLWRWWSLLYLY